jgi:L-amino acid N-acyltransferase YncA
MNSVQIVDVSKTVRILVQYAIKEKEQTREIFTAKNNFHEQKLFRKNNLSIELYTKQKQFLDSCAKEHNLEGPEVSFSLTFCLLCM